MANYQTVRLGQERKVDGSLGKSTTNQVNQSSNLFGRVLDTKNGTRLLLGNRSWEVLSEHVRLHLERRNSREEFVLSFWL